MLCLLVDRGEKPQIFFPDTTKFTDEEILAKKPDYISEGQFILLMIKAGGVPSIFPMQDIETNPTIRQQRSEFLDELKILVCGEAIIPQEYERSIVTSTLLANNFQKDSDLSAESIETLKAVGKVLGYDLSKGRGKK